MSGTHPFVFFRRRDPAYFVDHWVRPGPFAARRAKRHLLNKLPFEMWQKVLGCARAGDYAGSLRVSGEYKVLMRPSLREIPLEFKERAVKDGNDVYRSAETWAQTRSGCPLTRISLGKEFLMSVDFEHNFRFLSSAFRFEICRGRCNIILLAPKGLRFFVYNNLDRCCHSWEMVEG